MWGRRKKMMTITIAGKLTEKQYEKVERAILKIAERYDLGYQEMFDE